MFKWLSILWVWVALAAAYQFIHTGAMWWIILGASIISFGLLGYFMGWADGASRREGTNLDHHIRKWG